ncbi:MAG: hypothetical protein ACXVB9_07565 [Bdellovibrionota bacterium]
MNISILLLGLSLNAHADVGPVQGGSTVGDSGTAPAAPSANPDVTHGVLEPGPNGADTYIPPGSSLLDSKAQAREGVDSLGGFDGTEPTPGVVPLTPARPSDLNAPAPGPIPAPGAGVHP